MPFPASAVRDSTLYSVSGRQMKDAISDDCDFRPDLRETGPVRPFLLSVMLYSTWRLIPQRSIGWTASSLILSFLPELLHVWNEYKSSRVRAEGTPAAVLPVSAKLRLEIPTMGCVACVNKIDTSIRQCETSGRIIRGTSWLDGGSQKGGRAEVLISGSDETDMERIQDDIMKAVKGAGFDCTVESLVVQ